MADGGNGVIDPFAVRAQVRVEAVPIGRRSLGGLRCCQITTYWVGDNLSVGLMAIRCMATRTLENRRLHLRHRDDGPTNWAVLHAVPGEDGRLRHRNVTGIPSMVHD